MKIIFTKTNIHHRLFLFFQREDGFAFNLRIIIPSFERGTVLSTTKNTKQGEEMQTETLESSRAIIINDASKSNPSLISQYESIANKMQSFKLKTGNYLKYITFKEYIPYLQKMIEKELDGNTILIYPGMSAQEIGAWGFSNKQKEIFVYAKRLWIPGENPIVTVETLSFDIDTKTRKIIVVDDVISSGDTLNLLYIRNAWRFPNAKWHGGALVSRKTKLKFFESISAPIYCPQGKCGRNPPINSISTLVENNEIRLSYLKRNFEEPALVEEVFC